MQRLIRAASTCPSLLISILVSILGVWSFLYKSLFPAILEIPVIPLSLIYIYTSFISLLFIWYSADSADSTNFDSNDPSTLRLRDSVAL